jgi:hypothetical protein
MGLLGYEPEPIDPETQLLFDRGLMDEQWVVDKILAPEFGADNLIRQKAVAWPHNDLPIGELHTDVFVISEGMPIEIKSHADGGLVESDFVQLEGQLHFDPDAGEVGTLIVVDRDLHREAIPVKLTDEGRERVEDLAASVIEAGRTGVLPERTCAHPGEGIGRRCPFIDQCFAGWERPDPVNLDGDRAALLAEAFRLKTRRAQLKEPYDEVDSEYRAVCAELSEQPIPPGLELRGGGVKAKRTNIADRESFSLKDARRAGIWTAGHDELFGPFVKLAGGHTRWSFSRDESAPLLAEDFGDEAPWSDADLDGGAS